jgi:hypothetical protein
MKWIKSLIHHGFLVAVFLGLSGFTTPQSSASKQSLFAKEGGSVSKGRVSQAELQDDLLRFESQFSAQIESASQVLETSTKSKIRYRAALNRLIYSSNSLIIALDPIPEANLLDMITFIELSRDALEKHWRPNLFGAGGQPLNQVFIKTSQQIWGIAEKVLDPQEKSVLQNVISVWRSKYPNQINVETVRLSAFSTEAGAKAAGLDQDDGGLFAGLEQSTQSVDSIRLFSERALYYAELAPFLFRLQARLGANEIISDVGLNLARLPSPLAHESTIRVLLKEFRETLLKEWNYILSSDAYHKGISQAAALANQVDQQSNQFLKRVAWLGFSLIAFFWMMFFLSKVAYQDFLLKAFSSVKSQSQNKPKDKVA